VRDLNVAPGLEWNLKRYERNPKNYKIGFIIDLDEKDFLETQVPIKNVMKEVTDKLISLGYNVVPFNFNKID
jgi:hypothetical protein